jgi:glucose-1-phosphate thymidylyltransferase
VRKAVILARGLGQRMRTADADAGLSAPQAAVANTGLKAMMPVGRPFLDYSLSALADAGYQDICLVIGPEHQVIRDHYTVSAPPRRLRIHFALQSEALGTANAVLAAEEFVNKEDFLTINSDNYYPLSALRALRMLKEPGVALFEPGRLIAEGIPREKIRRFATCKVDSEGYLERITEKPSEMEFTSTEEEVLVSLNCWRFPATILDACRRVPLSSRGEYELPDAVETAMKYFDIRFRVVRCQEGVLDLSSRGDVAIVARKLAGVAANP